MWKVDSLLSHGRVPFPDFFSGARAPLAPYACYVNPTSRSTVRLLFPSSSASHSPRQSRSAARQG